MSQSHERRTQPVVHHWRTTCAVFAATAALVACTEPGDDRADATGGGGGSGGTGLGGGDAGGAGGQGGATAPPPPSGWDHFGYVDDVHDIVVDGDVVWFGTTAGVVRADTTTGVQLHYTAANSGLVGSQVRDLAVAGDGTVWAVTDSALAVFDGTGWAALPAGLDGTPLQLMAVAPAPSGAVWVGTAFGLYLLEDGEWGDPGSPFGDAQVRAIVHGDDGSTWVAASTAVFRHLDGSWEEYDIPGSELDLVFDLAMGADGRLSAATFHGPYQFDGSSWAHVAGVDAVALRVAVDDAGSVIWGFEDGTVGRYQDGSWSTEHHEGGSASALASGAGGLWVGMRGREVAVLEGVGCAPLMGAGGVHRESAGSWSTFDLEPHALARGRVGAVHVRSDGSGLVGSMEGTHELLGEEWTVPPGETAPVDVRRFAADANGGVWAASWCTGALFHEDGGAWTSSRPFDSDSAAVGTVIVDGVQRKWASVHDQVALGWGRLLRSQNQGWEIVDTADADYPYPEAEVGGMALGPDGSLWVAWRYRAEIGRYHGSTWSLLSLPTEVDAVERGPLAVGADGRLWLGTWDGGLVSYDGGTFTLHQPSTPLFVSALMVDSQGRIWAGGAPFDSLPNEGGLVRFDGDDWRTFDMLHGLPSNHVASLAEGADGSIWVGTSAGLTIIDADDANAP